MLHDLEIVRFGTPDEVLSPEILEPVYGLSVRRLDLGSSIHLLFGEDD